MSYAPRFSFGIYADDGAEWQFLSSALQAYAARRWPNQLDIRLIRREEVLSGGLRTALTGNGAANPLLAFFLPGSRRGETYRAGLGRDGFQYIGDYIADGGCFTGICSGGYLACRAIDYSGFGERKQVTGPAAFFAATARGRLWSLWPVDAPAADCGWQRACVTPLRLWQNDQAFVTVPALYWGGAELIPDAGEDVTVMARYAALEGPAIAMASKIFGAGRVVFSGVHPEVSGAALRSLSRYGHVMEADGGAYRLGLAAGLERDIAGGQRLFDRMVDVFRQTDPARQMLGVVSNPAPILGMQNARTRGAGTASSRPFVLQP
jgi:glutamine amidotransferase-like uncharacterized protein